MSEENLDFLVPSQFYWYLSVWTSTRNLTSTKKQEKTVEEKKSWIKSMFVALHQHCVMCLLCSVTDLLTGQKLQPLQVESWKPSQQVYPGLWTCPLLWMAVVLTRSWGSCEVLETNGHCVWTSFNPQSLLTMNQCSFVSTHVIINEDT